MPNAADDDDNALATRGDAATPPPPRGVDVVDDDADVDVVSDDSADADVDATSDVVDASDDADAASAVVVVVGVGDVIRVAVVVPIVCRSFDGDEGEVVVVVDRLSNCCDEIDVSVPLVAMATRTDNYNSNTQLLIAANHATNTTNKPTKPTTNKPTNERRTLERRLVKLDSRRNAAIGADVGCVQNDV
jgi:hypothetical protein